MTLHYARNVRNSGPSRATPQDVENRVWHQDCIRDTGTSHTLPGRLYVVQCEWCEDAFVANTKNEAMELFRRHEDDMLEIDRA